MIEIRHLVKVVLDKDDRLGLIRPAGTLVVDTIYLVVPWKCVVILQVWTDEPLVRGLLVNVIAVQDTHTAR